MTGKELLDQIGKQEKDTLLERTLWNLSRTDPDLAVQACDELAALHTQNAALLAALKELYGLLEEEKPQWYTMGHYKRARAAIEAAEKRQNDQEA